MQSFLKFLLLIAAGTAFGQPYPSKPVHLVVAFPPGGPVDIIARLITPRMSEALGQPIVVENKTCAAARLPLAPEDLIPVAVVASQPNLILVNAEFPARSLAELLQMARAQKLAFASPSSGTTPHLTAENLFRVRAKLDITHVPFRGAGPAVAALLGGQPPIGSLAGSEPMPHIKSGKLRALAVSSSKRLASLPDVPTLTELGYSDMEDYTWVGLFLPAGTPVGIAQKVNDAVLRSVQGPDLRERLDALAFDVTAAPLRETADYVKSELVKWAKVVRDTGAKAE